FRFPILPHAPVRDLKSAEDLPLPRYVTNNLRVARGILR
ncbi:MAG: hypothetical protein RLZ44_986, partial [Pseudomonadota bacterium]